MMDNFLFHGGSRPHDSDDRAGGVWDSQAFVAGLAGLPPEEVQKAKILFIRNAISAYKDARRRKLAELAFPAIVGPAFFLSIGAFASAGMPGMPWPSPQLFFMIPALFFWVMAAVQFYEMKSSLVSQKEQIRNAMEVWRHDFGKETFELDF